MRWQRGALRPRLRRFGLRRQRCPQLLELRLDGGDVGLDGLVEQLLLLGPEPLAARAELLPLQLRDLEGQLVDP